MPFCANCGTSVTGTFCSNCGASVASGPGAGSAAAVNAGAGLSENAAGALCYALGLLTGILFLVLAPYNQNPRVKFNAWQSILFNVAWIAFWIVVHMFGAFLVSALSVMSLLLLPVYMAISLGGFLLWLFLMWRAYQGNPFNIPVLSGIARQQAGV